MDNLKGLQALIMYHCCLLVAVVRLLISRFSLLISIVNGCSNRCNMASGSVCVSYRYNCDLNHHHIGDNCMKCMQM